MAEVLIVDDEHFILDSVSFVLDLEGIAHERATTAAEAREAARRVRPRIMLLDVMLPDGLGYDVCRDVRRAELTPRPWIIMLSARGQVTDIEAGRRAGADDYIVKPFSPAELVGKVKSALAGAGGSAVELGRTG